MKRKWTDKERREGIDRCNAALGTGEKQKTFNQL